MDLDKIRDSVEYKSALGQSMQRENEDYELSQFGFITGRTSEGWLVDGLTGQRLVNPQILAENRPAAIGQVVDVTLKCRPSIDYLANVSTYKGANPPAVPDYYGPVDPEEEPQPCISAALWAIKVGIETGNKMLLRRGNQKRVKSQICRLVKADIWDKLDAMVFLRPEWTGNFVQPRNKPTSTGILANATCQIPASFKYNPRGFYYFSTAITGLVSHVPQGGGTPTSNLWQQGDMASFTWGGVSIVTGFTVRNISPTVKALYSYRIQNGVYSETLIETDAGDVGEYNTYSISGASGNGEDVTISAIGQATNNSTYGLGTELRFAVYGGPALTSSKFDTLRDATRKLYEAAYTAL